MAKSSRVPHIALAALLGAAALTAWGGVRLAREEHVEQIKTGHEEVAAFSAGLMRQMLALELVFENHLQRIATEADPEDAFSLRRLCDTVKGIRQVARITPETDSNKDIVVEIPGGIPSARPVFERSPETRTPLAGETVYVLAPLLKDSGLGDSGWIDQPGMPLMFWSWRSFGEVIVITPDPAVVGGAIRGWMAEWFENSFAAVEASGAIVKVAGLGGSGTPPEDAGPGLFQPVRGRFASFDTALWDSRETVVTYDSATLMLTAVITVSLALLGFFIFVFQRRAFRESERRVSFVNRVSHELRSPLTNILLNTDLTAQAMEAGSPRAGERLKVIREEAGRLSRLIANVLTFSRRNEARQELSRETVNLASSVESTLAPFLPTLNRHNIRVETSIPETLNAIADPDATSQILANLISNVEKYAAGGGLLRIEATESNAGEIEIAVSDSGPGIDAGARERIFAPFVRLDSRVNEGSSGTGLGLAIGRDLAGQMDGSLKAVEQKQGARFVLTLPQSQPNIIPLSDAV